MHGIEKMKQEHFVAISDSDGISLLKLAPAHKISPTFFSALKYPIAYGTARRA